MAEPRRERKVVTVLFADLVGFTARAEELDPEDVEAILRPYHERLRSELERFGGTVEKFIGDAVMALFGAPVAHEDDPERAVRAALAIRDWAREEESVQVRIAVNTGEALINLGARPESGEGMAAGDVVNTTARLQNAAPVNGVLVGETTYRATRDAIDYEERDPVEAKGKAEPIPVWEAREARARFGVDIPLESRVPLVAREREFALLRDSFARARESSAVQLVTIVGEPGIGKTRLVYELFAELSKGPELTYWRQGRSLPYGEGVTLWALAEMVKAQAGVLETDSDAEAARKVAEAVKTALGDDPQAGWVESHLRPLVGRSAEEMPAGDRRDESFAAWRRLFEGLAEQRPLVLVFEDLQWADDTLLDFVDHLVDWASGVPILVVATARPELLDRRPDWGGGKRNAVTISLEPLADDETAKLVGLLLDRPVLPAETQTLLLERAGGNPLYAEQYARILGEQSEEAELPLPESVQGIIAARLDLLAPDDKSLLQNAAVLGKVFWTGAVAALGGSDRREVEQQLHALERKDFIQVSRRSSVAEEREYAFRHLLVRDVAYGQIPRAERGERHRQAAQWIESLGRPEDHAEMLAHHYVTAFDLATAAGADTSALVEPVQRSLREAGDRAAGLNAFGAAARFYERAVEFSAEPDSELLFRFAESAHFAGDDRKVELLERARDALVASGREERAAEATVLLAEAFWQLGNVGECHRQLEYARAAVETTPLTPAKVRILAYVGRYLALAAQSEESLRVNREVVELAESLGLEDLRLHALTYIGQARVNQGDLAGVDDIRRAAELGAAIGSPQAARYLGNLAAMNGQMGNTRRAFDLHKEALEAAERAGNAPIHRHLRGWQPNITYQSGRWDEALEYANEFIAECEAGSPHYMEPNPRMTRAQILLARGREDEAASEIDLALRKLRSGNDPQGLGPAFAMAARLSLVLGRIDEATSLFDEMLEQSGGGCLAVAYAYNLTWIADDLGRGVELRRFFERGLEGMPWVAAGQAVLDGDLARAIDVLEAVDSISAASFARLRAAQNLVQEGRRAEADEHLAKALAFFRSVKATRLIREGEALLAATA